MRCALYFEFEVADSEKVYEANDKIQAHKAKNPDKYPKDIFPPQGHLFGKPSGFYIVEGTQEQVFQFVQAWAPYKKIRVELIKDAMELPNLGRLARNIV